MKTRLEVNMIKPEINRPFLVLDIHSDPGGAFASTYIYDLTPEDLEAVAAQYRTALEVHRANAIGTALEGLEGETWTKRP